MRCQRIETLVGSLVTEVCYKCKAPFAMSRSLFEAAQQAGPKISFFCPNGHSQQYVEGESETDKLRRERNRLQQEQARLHQCITEEREAREQTERQLFAQRGQVTKIKNRVSRGVCPCCNRSFANLRQHMASKHDGFAASGADAA